jgi:sugar transferase (PEP-CTERM/EpsH1 system associated)
MKKDLLIIVHRIPYPPDKGDKIRTYHMLRHLAERYRVTVACMIDDPDDVKHVTALQKMVHQVYFEVRTTKMMKLHALASLVTGRSFSQQCFYSKRLQRSIDDYLDNYAAAAILCFCSSTAEYLYRSRHDFKSLQQKVLLNDLIDVDSEKWGQYADKKGAVMKWLYQREARLLLPCELRIATDFDRTFLVSEEEKQVLAAHGAVDKVEALSNGVDLDYFSSAKVSKELYPTAASKLVFSGAMDYWPNIEGAVWFAENIFPIVKESVPEAIFCIAGRNPTDEILALQKIPGIEVTGTVPDMRDHLATAAICVVPLLIARGIQNKVLEAMAMEKPVIATTGAATGTKAVDGQELIVADDEQQMAKEIITLLADAERQCEIGRNARQYVEREHSWESHLARLNEIIDNEIVLSP